MKVKGLEEQRYSYADYLTWDDRERWELIDGVPYAMAAPRRSHQKISMNLSRVISTFLLGKKCEVYAAPFDVRLEKVSNDDNSAIYTVVQPDISVFCDLSRLDEKGATGAPDFIIEILSESTVLHDLNRKLALYEKNDVKEYWVVSPTEQIIQVHLLKDGKYSHIKQYEKEDKIPVQTLEGLEIALAEIFIEVF